MQHIIDEIKATFMDFLDDEDKPLMLIETTANDGMLLLKTLDMLEEDERSPDVFMTYLEDFNGPRSYIDELFENQVEQLEAVNEELAKREEPPLEAFPPQLYERSLINHERLTGIVSHVRKIVSPDRKVVWTFFPLNESDESEAFTNLLRFLSVDLFDEKIDRTKLIIRDTLNSELKQTLEPFKDKIFYCKPDIDLQSILKKIEEQTRNTNAPPDERAQNLMLLAGADIAEKKFDSALAKNESVLKHFEDTKQKEKQSLVHNSIGDIHYLKGDFPLAQRSYEKAVSISIDQESQPLIIYQSINLGNSLFMQNKFDEALIYYESSEKLSELNETVMQRIQALERIGDSKKAQGEIDAAIHAWEKAAEICRENAYKIGMVSVLEKLDRAYEEKGDTQKRRKNLKELEDTKSEIREVEPALLERQ